MADSGPRTYDPLLVSVVVPAYNHGSFVGETLSSVLAQSYSHVEVIVVDDGSTDDTAQRVAAFQGRVAYYRQTNRGMAAARNRGIALAQGVLVSFLDDDDLWEPDYLETVVAVFAADADVAAVYTGFGSLDACGRLLPQGGTRVVAPEDLHDALVEGGFFPACCLTVRKAVLDEIGGLDETLRGNDDWELLLRLSRRRRVVGLARPLALHREHSGGLSSNYEHMLQDNLLAVAKHFGGEEGVPTEWPEERRRAYAGAYFLSSVGHLLQGDTELGCRRFSRSVMIYPPIAGRVSTWYDIACSYQPKGWRGHAASLDLARSERQVNEVVAYVARSALSSQADRSWMSHVQASAALALGLLAYQKGEMKVARRHLGRAVRLRPVLLFHHSLVSRYLKSLLGGRLLSSARRAFRVAPTPVCDCLQSDEAR